MAFTNSQLVAYSKLSPNYNPRSSKIDTITPHIVVGHLSLKTLGKIFANSAREASSNYGIDDFGASAMFVEEKNRSWCSSSAANDHRAITIEIASDTTYPYAITDKAMQGLIFLCADICKRNKIPKLLWKADKSLIGKIDQQNISVHRWFAPKECPGEYVYSRLGDVAAEVNKILIPTPIQQTAAWTYAVKINADSLNYRQGPGIYYPIVGKVHKGEIYTIVDEAYGAGSSKWGKLKSGAGWISLDYCTKVW